MGTRVTIRNDEPVPAPGAERKRLVVAVVAVGRLDEDETKQVLVEQQSVTVEQYECQFLMVDETKE